jgi:exopolyphosphatase/guanosine-5'-triphosphate,3'-diphosphate pyrophosphatase
VKLATIDIGTNTTLLLVAEGTRPDDVRVVLERAEITRLGRGIGKDGRLGADGISRTLGVLAEYAALARAQEARLAAVGTEALRRAPNAEEFLEPAAALLGQPVEVIDGAREASLTFRAAATSFPAATAGTVAVVDIGGGSTEVILAEAGSVRIRESLPLGSVRLTERHVHHDPADDAEVAAIFAEIDVRLERLPLPTGGIQLVGTAGTVTTLAAMAMALADYDPARVHGYQLTRQALEAQVERLRRSRQSEREAMVGLDPRRADVILAGACVLSAIVRRVGAPAVLVSDRGIRWGLLYELLAGPVDGK